MSTTAYSFDDLNSDKVYSQPSKPIYALDLDDPSNEKEILNWLQAELHFLEHENEPRIRIQRRNLALYKGIQYQESEARAENRDRAADRNRSHGADTHHSGTPHPPGHCVWSAERSDDSGE